MDKRALLQKRDIPLLLAVLLAAVCGFLLLWRSPSATVLIIEQDGRELYRYTVAELIETTTVTVDGRDGYDAVIEIGGSGARFVQAGCPDKLCVKSGWVSKGNEAAICLPGRISIRAQSGSAADAVTY